VKTKDLNLFSNLQLETVYFCRKYVDFHRMLRNYVIGILIIILHNYKR